MATHKAKTISPLQEQWTSSNAVFEQLRSVIEAKAVAPKTIQKFEIQDRRLFVNETPQLDDGVSRKNSAVVLNFRSVEPHTDPTFPWWFAAWVINGQSRTLHSADMTERQFQKRMGVPVAGKLFGLMNQKSAAASSLDNGSFILFDAHRVHWVPPQPGQKEVGPPCTVIVEHFKARPTREKVEKTFLDVMQAFIPLIENEAKPAAPRRRRP